MQMATAIYRLTRGFPREELYSLTSQIRRSAISENPNSSMRHKAYLTKWAG
jgi:four helix bundle protein